MPLAIELRDSSVATRRGFMNAEDPWTVYRTRFVVRARQLTHPLVFTDALGREHSGQSGDYLVESSQGFRRITPRELFEDIYVPLEPTPRVPASASFSGTPRPDGSIKIDPVQDRVSEGRVLAWSSPTMSPGHTVRLVARGS